MNDINFIEENHLGLVTLNRPQALNALTLPMILALQRQLQEWEQNDKIHAVIIRAASGKAFCAGGDVRWLYDKGKQRDPEQLQFFWHEYRLNHYIHHYRKPYIALMDGITMGGGVGISLHGSHPIATERFVFAMPETSIGFFPDIGASHILSRCCDQVGIYLGLTGQSLTANEALQMGLVHDCIASEQGLAMIAALQRMDLSHDAHQRVTKCIAQFSNKTAMTETPTLPRAAITNCFQHQQVETILSALATVNDAWHETTYQQMLQKAPLSLKVTLAQLQKASSLSLADCLSMDYHLVQHFMQDHDFYEGVRALLVDKDKQPHWLPATLHAADEKQVMHYFTATQSSLEFLV